MRRPLSIQRADAREGWLEVLYKPVGQGLAALTRVRPGDTLNLLGPIGHGFDPDPARPRCVLIGGGVGIPPLLFLAERLADSAFSPLAFFGSELPFPFVTREAGLPLAVPPAATHSLAMLEDWGVPGRLASGAGLPGCYEGFVTELAREWFAGLDRAGLDECAVYACGPDPMLAAAQRLAADFELPSQLCLEEYMACAVGGCAGCAVEIHADEGTSMRRVCVDGPVFDGYSVYPSARA
jgi:dihydroorotate dehydrogenase electron transfer subunit